MYRPSNLYPLNWNNLRWALFKKYNYTCQKCGAYAKGRLHLHHIIPITRGGSSGEDNLLVLCDECHFNIHKKRFI
jgi:5-methylcytosine-specific restriction endonuclease McrA